MKRAVLVLVILAAALSTDGAAKQVRLKADRVVLRLQPSFRAEVVTQVRKGTILESTGSDGDWIQVTPPEDVYYYVHSDYVNKGLVTGAKVRVRTGPGIGHAIVEELQRGERVDVKGIWEEWVKITPPKGSVLWVHGTLVEDVSPPRPDPALAPIKNAAATVKNREGDEAKRPTVVMPPPVRRDPVKKPVVSAPKPNPVKSQVVTTRPVVAGGQPSAPQPPAELKKRGLIPLQGQGRIATYRGLLAKRGFLSSAIKKYRLLDTGQRGKRSVCYVMGNAAQLSTLVDSVVSVAGREYWVRGEELPVLVATEILVRQRPAEGRRR